MITHNSLPYFLGKCWRCEHILCGPPKSGPEIFLVLIDSLQPRGARRHWARVLVVISLASNASGLQIKQEQVLALTSCLKERWPQAFLVKESKQPWSPDCISSVD